MRVVLINPALDFRRSLGAFSKFLPPMPSTGIGYIAAVLEREGVEVSVVDDFIERKGVEYVAESVIKMSPDVVGFSCLTANAEQCYEISKLIRRRINPTIVFGNVHSTVFDAQIVKDGIADVVVRGEGEYTMLDLVKTVERGGDLKSVRGITFLQDGEIVRTGSPRVVEDLDSLPFPAWHLFPRKKYQMVAFIHTKSPSYPITGSRGCPYNCTYCCKLVMGNRRRVRSPKNIVDEIEYLIMKFGARSVAFTDEIFPFHREEAIDLCEEMISRGVNEKIEWVVNTRVDAVDDDVLKMMRRAGCRRVMFGLESGDPERLREVRKTTTIEDAKRAVRAARNAGIETVGFFMLGLPGETVDSCRRTIEFAKDLDLDFAKFGILVPYPGSALYEMMKDKLEGVAWHRYTPYSPDPVYVPDGMRKEDLLRMQRRATIEFYLRPRLIARHLFKIRSIPIGDMLRSILFLMGA